MNNKITEMKNTLEEINSRLGYTEEHISDLEDRIIEITQSELQKEKQIKTHNKIGPETEQTFFPEYTNGQ